MFSKIRSFFSEVGLELKKTTWPWNPKETGFKKFKELTDSTVIVIVAIIFLGAFVAFWDFIMSGVMGLLVGGLS